MVKLADHDERVKAARELARNVVVVAGAGTGKTTLLVERILRNILIGEISITRMAALTFTEKAANEMKLRLIEKMERMLRNEEIEPWLEEIHQPASHIHKLLTDTLNDMDKAHIRTIHSFCAHLLRLYPLEAGVVPDFQVDEGDFFDQHFFKEWHLWLDRELAESSPRRELWLSLLNLVTLDQLEDLAEQLSRFTMPFESIEQALEEKDESEPIRRALEAVIPFVSEFRKSYIEAGYVNFDGLLLLTRDMLRDRPDVLRRIQKDFARILVDEFQDTDPLQAEILFYIAGPPPALQPGKLFLVGDPKQSIYSFRGAHVEAYEHARELIETSGGLTCELTTNFRSHEGIIRVVNPLFEKIIREDPPLQPRYIPIQAHPERRQNHPFQKVELLLMKDPAKSLGAEEARKREAEAIADTIQRVVGKTDILDDKGVRRPVKYQDIALLLRKLSNLDLYLAPFKREEIPYVVQGEKFFYTTSEVTTFLNLLTLIDNPHDPLALVGYLRSPFGGLTDREIYDLEQQNALDYLNETVSIPESVRKIYGSLRSLRERAQRLPVGDLIHTLFQETHLPEIAAGSFHGEQVVANLFKIEATAKKMSYERGTTLKQFIRWLRRQVKDREEEGESPLSDETLDAVRILTIHKAKGLEFPVVILADLHGQKGGRGPEETDVHVITQWPQKKIGIEIGDTKNSAFDVIQEHVKARQEAEERRNLYVAMTRARERLVLTGSADFKARSYLADLDDALGAILQTAPGQIIKAGDGEIELTRVTSVKKVRPRRETEKETVKEAEPDWKMYRTFWDERAERDRRIRETPYVVSPSMLQGGRVRIYDEQDEEIESKPNAANVIGLISHRVMELWDFEEKSLTEAIRNAINGIGAEDPPAATEEVKTMFATFVRSEAFRELKEAEVLGREVPFVMPWKDRIAHGVMDVIYRHHGRVVVADYKTDRVEPGREREKLEGYAAQREMYSEAVRRALDSPDITFKLIFLRTGTLIQV